MNELRPLDIDDMERAMLKIEQVEGLSVDCPVIHRFSPGLYIREVFIPADTLALGHFQKTEHLNIFLQGKIMMLSDNGEKVELKAPMMFTGKPGRKLGYIREDVVWLNIYPTSETNIEKLEETYLDKSDGWKEIKKTENREIETIINLLA